MNQELGPSRTPLHSNLWIGREPASRELSDEFSNVYKLLRLLLEEVQAVREFVQMPED